MDILARWQQIQHKRTQAALGLLRIHHEEVHDGFIADLPLYDGHSSIDFEGWMQNVERTNITSYDIV